MSSPGGSTAKQRKQRTDVCLVDCLFYKTCEINKPNVSPVPDLRETAGHYHEFKHKHSSRSLRSTDRWLHMKVTPLGFPPKCHLDCLVNRNGGFSDIYLKEKPLKASRLHELCGPIKRDISSPDTASGFASRLHSTPWPRCVAAFSVNT